MRFCLLVGASVLSAGPSLAQGYAAAVPDLARVDCVFRAVTDPVIPATSVQIRRAEGEAAPFVWVEAGLPPLPVLGFFRQPETAQALASVGSADLGGVFAMISYDAGGEAVLSKHSARANGLAWSAQRGTCLETKKD